MHTQIDVKEFKGEIIQFDFIIGMYFLKICTITFSREVNIKKIYDIRKYLTPGGT